MPETNEQAKQAPNEGNRPNKHHHHHHGRNHHKPREESQKPNEKEPVVKAEAPQENASQKAPAPAAAVEGGQKKNKNRHGRHHGNRHGRREEDENVDEALEEAKQKQAEAENEAFNEVLSASVPTQDKDYGFVTDSKDEPKVVYDESGAPAPVDFDEIPGKAKPIELTEEEKAEMTMVVGVRFRNSSHSYFFSPGNMKLGIGVAVIVETSRGLEYGTISFSNRYVKNSEIQQPLREVLRIATETDTAQHKANLELEEQAFTICKAQILKHELDMKLIDAQYTFDNAKLLFYFSSGGRVDFRDLVKDLAGIFHTRIELRQIGIRDEARMLGGLGACGRQLCCAGFLLDFAQVSIKMAKEQNLSLNSNKISGCCGRLLCCLHYEHETYEAEIAQTPPVDTVVETEDGIGMVTAINPLAGTVRVTIRSEKGDVTMKNYNRDTVKVLPKDALPVYENKRSEDAPKAPTKQLTNTAPATDEKKAETPAETTEKTPNEGRPNRERRQNDRKNERQPRREQPQQPRPTDKPVEAPVAQPKEEPKVQAAAPQGENAPQTDNKEGSTVLGNIKVSFPKTKSKNRHKHGNNPNGGNNGQNGQNGNNGQNAAQPKREEKPKEAQTPVTPVPTAPAPVASPAQHELDGVVRPTHSMRRGHHGQRRPFNPNK